MKESMTVDHNRSTSSSERLRHTIEHTAHLLPAQGPITVFIHHNTLHAFEELPFDKAVRRGADLFGCQPYLSEERYRAELQRGRIGFDDLRAVLTLDLGDRASDSLVGLANRLQLYLAMLEHPVWTGPPDELAWFVAETDALRRVRQDVSAATRSRLIAETRRWVMCDLRGQAGASGTNGQAVPDWARDLFREYTAAEIEAWDNDNWEEISLQVLWQVVCDGVRTLPLPARKAAKMPRYRDLLLAVTHADTDVWVHDVLIRFCAAFLDQGQGHWVLPDRHRGFYQSFLSLYRLPAGPANAWLGELPHEATRLQDQGISALDCISESLSILGVPEQEWDAYLSATLLALRGWAGMVCQVEQRGDRVAHPIPRDSLLEFLAIRLLLDRLAVSHVARKELGHTGSLATLRAYSSQQMPQPPRPTVEQRAFPVFQLAQVLGWSPADLHQLTPGEWALLVGQIEAFSAIERRRVFHLAYERRFRTQVYDAVVLHECRDDGPGADLSRPRFQLITCLDEREESFRRHVEEIAPDVETFGAAGFYGVAMYYRGAADAYFVPLCPIVLTPQHWVEEQVCDGHEDTHRRRAQTRKALGQVAHRFRVGTRSFALGAILTGGLGVLASIPLVARILFPRLTARIGDLFGHYVRTPPATRLQLERSEATPGSSNGQLGFSLEEMANISLRMLQDIGLTTRFARLVFVLGHGSDSVNNPHKSAYDCGACGGSCGAPNGRALAQMLNDPRVRGRLAERGVPIPEDTWFVGGYHNTCDDSVHLADLDRVPESHRHDLERARADLEQTCDRNAHERCRRFMSASLSMPFAEGRRHVEARSTDLAQPRPELGHATNAICIVGRRHRTRGLFLDRRAFLTSYDPTIDDAQGTILARILAAAVPVCGGINLEYYFSHVDCRGYGCGSKLPHNLTSFLGVMDGAASDLRTGLPWQMVEIHEPVRILFIIETTPATLLGIMDRNPLIDTLVRKDWVQLAVLDPTRNEIRHFRDGNFEVYQPQAESLPMAATSTDWYRGWREHLEFAEIGQGCRAGQRSGLGNQTTSATRRYDVS